MSKNVAELLSVACALRDYVDSLPKHLQLPAMPGVNRDWMDSVIKDFRGEANSDRLYRPFTGKVQRTEEWSAQNNAAMEETPYIAISEPCIHAWVRGIFKFDSHTVDLEPFCLKCGITQSNTKGRKSPALENAYRDFCIRFNRRMSALPFGNTPEDKILAERAAFYGALVPYHSKAVEALEGVMKWTRELYDAYCLMGHWHKTYGDDAEDHPAMIAADAFIHGKK